jgi:hypothetical protein
MDIQPLIYECIAQATAPITAAEIAPALQAKTTTKSKPKALAAALTALADAGRITALKSLRTGTTATCYTTQKPSILATAALAQVITALPTALPMTKLKALLRKPLRPWFDEALGHLIVHGSAYYVTRGKTRLVQPHPPKPSELLIGPALAQTKKLLEAANRRRKTPRSISDFLAWLDAEDSEPIHIIQRPKPRRAITAEQLRAWHQADAARSSSSMVPIPQTFARYQTWSQTAGEAPDADLFKRALRDLYDSGIVMLEPHERPQQLPADERDLQVPMSLGPPGYYWGLLG